MRLCVYVCLCFFSSAACVWFARFRCVCMWMWIHDYTGRWILCLCVFVTWKHYNSCCLLLCLLFHVNLLSYATEFRSLCSFAATEQFIFLSQQTIVSHFVFLSVLYALFTEYLHAVTTIYTYDTLIIHCLTHTAPLLSRSHLTKSKPSLSISVGFSFWDNCM